MQELITNFGLPIAMLLSLAWYFVRTQDSNITRYDALVADIKAESREREQKLYQVISENQALNRQLAENINTKIDNVLDVLEKKG